MTNQKMRDYRPFITNNFCWDFPSRFNLKEVSKFLDEDIDPTTEYISNTAKVIMKNDGIYWFIQKKEAKQISALISLSDLDLKKHSAALMITFKDLTDDEKKEISDRLLIFLRDQILLTDIEINDLDHLVQENFTNNGYTIFNKKLLKRS